MSTAKELQQALDAALNLHGAGRLRDAEKLYRQILGTNPTHSEALHYLGVIGLQLGRLDDAAELIGKAVAIRPDYAEAITNLGNALQAQGRFTDAAEQFQRALKLDPESAVITANLGHALAQQSRYGAAVEQYEAALSIDADLADARRCLADCLLKLGRPTEALQQVVLATERGGQSVSLQVSMGNILQDLGRSEEAIACFESILKSTPDFPPLLCSLGNVLRQSGRMQDAIQHYEKALRLDPDYAEGHYNLGMAYLDIGDKDGASDSFRRAAALDKHCTKAWRSLASVTRLRSGDPDFQAIQAADAIDDYSPEQQTHLAFALGKCHEDVQDYKTAIRQYHRGNRLRRASFDYDLQRDLTAFDNLKARFDAEFIARWSDAGIDDSTPIFVIGMPRSGTTLVEQILASHPQVFGGGELRLLARAIAQQFAMPDGVDYSESLLSATRDDFRAVATTYVSNIRKLNATARRITDKLPNNFLNVGLIRILLPKAHIVHCVRDPRDTCFSIYKHYFGARGHYYAYELAELAQYYNAYADLMKYWNGLLPESIHEVRYETLVADQEAVTRSLLKACDLNWDPACLAFHETARPVATISASQVRQPLYSGSIGVWKNYRSELAPLLDTLTDSFEP